MGFHGLPLIDPRGLQYSLNAQAPTLR